MAKYSKILAELDISEDLVYNTHAKNVIDQFYSEEEKETLSKQPKQNTKKEQEIRRCESKEKCKAKRV